MSGWTIKRGAELVPVPWRNGLGTTRDVVTLTRPDGTLLWQVSIADLVADAPFSFFPHCDRLFTPIAGDPPPELAFDGGPFRSCPLLVPQPFSGEVPTLSRIPASGRAFNAVFDRRAFAVGVSVHRPGAAPMPVPAADATVLFCFDGTVATAGEVLAPGDSALALSGPAPAFAGPGTAILVLVHGRA